MTAKDFFAKKRKRKTKNELFGQREPLLGNNTATQSDKNIAPLWKFLNIRWRTNCNALTTLKKFAFQHKVKRRKILSKWRRKISWKKRKNKHHFVCKGKHCSAIILHLKVTKIVHRCKNFWIFSAKQRCGHTVLCTQTHQITNTLAGSLQTNYRRFVAQCPLQEQKKRPERGRLIYLFLRLCFSPSPSGFICFSTVGTTKTFWCNSETRACM